MDSVLFIKTSSLGDVIHHMPAVTDARRHFPQAHIAWVVEEAFAPLAALHPAVNTVIPVATRSWRGRLLRPSTWREIAQFRKTIQSRSYDVVIDTQGLLRTGLIASFARGVRHGYHRDSVRERLAARFYDVHHSVPRDLHAIVRNRNLTGLALGYQPEGQPDYGLARSAFPQGNVPPYAILLHATARAEKEWPEDNWVALGRALETRKLDLLVPWGNEDERARGERIVGRLVRGRVPMRRSLTEMAQVIAGATFVVGVDTGLIHLSAALGVPTVAIFVESQPKLTGPVGSGKIAVVGGKGAPPSAREVMAAVGAIAPL